MPVQNGNFIRRSYYRIDKRVSSILASMDSVSLYQRFLSSFRFRSLVQNMVKTRVLFKYVIAVLTISVAPRPLQIFKLQANSHRTTAFEMFVLLVQSPSISYFR